MVTVQALGDQLVSLEKSSKDETTENVSIFKNDKYRTRVEKLEDALAFLNQPSTVIEINAFLQTHGCDEFTPSIINADLRKHSGIFEAVGFDGPFTLWKLFASKTATAPIFQHVKAASPVETIAQVECRVHFPDALKKDGPMWQKVQAALRILGKGSVTDICALFDTHGVEYRNKATVMSGLSSCSDKFEKVPETKEWRLKQSRAFVRKISELAN